MADELDAREIYVVLAGELVVAAYTSSGPAQTHERCVTGARVVACRLLERVPREVRDELLEEWDSDSDTPVVPTAE